MIHVIHVIFYFLIFNSSKKSPGLADPAIQVWFLILHDFFDFFDFFNSSSESRRMDPSSTRPWFLIHCYFHDFPSSSRPWFLIQNSDFDFLIFWFLIQRKIRYARIRPSSRPWFMIFLHIWHRLHIDLPKFTQIGAGSPPNRPWFLILFLNSDFLIFLIF